MKYFLIGAVIFFSCFKPAYAKDELTWQVLHWPPWIMIKGQDSGEGRFNHIIKIAHEELPQYNHVTEEMNWARFWNEVEIKNNVCSVFAFKSGKKEDIVYFSEPHTFVLPNAIIMRRTDIEKLGNPKSYSIAQIMNDKRFVGVVEKTRSYTGTLDTILKKNEPGSNLSRVAEGSESLIKMVATGRINYTIEYPIVAAYYAQKQSSKSSSISSIPIAEMDPFSYVYLACTKNAWGKKVIEEWNGVLRQIKPSQKYRKITEMGHNDEGELNIIRENYDNFIKAQ